MKPSRLALTLAVLAAVGLAGCGGTDAPERSSPAAAAAAGTFPVEVTNCGRTLRFDKPPTRVVSGWPTSTELLIALGAADRLVGQYNTASGGPHPPYAEAYRRVAVLGQNAPSREALLAARPELIWADGSYLFDGQQLPTIEDLNAQGIRVLILSGFCTDDATAARVRDVDTDIAALGAILGIPDKASQLRADIDRRLADVAAKVAGTDPVPVAMVSTFDKAIYTYDGVYTDIARMAGARNIYAGALPKGKYFHEVSVEDLTRRDPATLVYLRSGGEDQAAARAWLTATLPTVQAVRSNRIVFLPQSDSTNLAGVEGVTTLAAALHP